MDTSCAPANDLASNRPMLLLLWGLPTALVVLGIFTGSTLLRTLLWAPAFLLMGAACVYNAAHCGRIHCYFSGPVFLIGGVASLLHGLGLMFIEWAWIGWGVVAGVALSYALESIRGTYARSNAHTAAGEPPR